MNQVLIEKIRTIVRDNESKWKKFYKKHGPCWPVCRVIANTFGGDIYFCKTLRHETNKWYGHYILVKNGEILDFSGEYLSRVRPEQIKYKGLKLFNGKKHQAWPEKCIKWWGRNLKHL